MTRIQSTGLDQPRLISFMDLSGAVELSTLAGWNQTLEDWRMLMEISPQACFGMDADRRLVSTATVVGYGRRLAWLGMVLTHPEYRGRGFARALMKHALDYADATGIETIKLDATDQGRPIYEGFGFIEEQPIERWIRLGTGAVPVSQHRGQTGFPLELDSKAFGADRTQVLQALRRHGYAIQADGFLCTRAGRSAAYLGPCVAESADVASAMITTCLNNSPGGTWVWDLFPANAQAVAIAAQAGFKRQRSLTRMSRGKALGPHDELVYAIAGFELG
jgi:GNAT superfamily N-acetyltransferase